MSTIVLLSSSPPPVFVRSPTPASSSPLPSTASLLQDRSPGRKRFKSKPGQRDGFSTSFSTARQVLKEKKGAENTLIMSPKRSRFRSSQDESFDKATSCGRSKSAPIIDRSTANDTLKSAPEAQATTAIEPKIDSVEDVTPVQLDKSKIKEKRSSEPLFLERAAARKVDWTPPKPQIVRHEDEQTIQYSAGFLNGMLSSFTYGDPSAKVSENRHNEILNPSKRRKVELPRTATVCRAASAPNLVKTNSLPAKSTSNRTRSPTKKALTITGVATSNYLGLDEVEESPMMQYLTSTQAQLHDTSAEAGLETKVQKTKAAVQKLKASKKNRSKSLLLSPQSALKTYDDQEAIFGSASQLAREDSPTFLRDIIEATKQSESFLMSDQMSSPQRTQPTSVDNTPTAGVSRFRKTRNLWAAAGRDDDNALLHVDTVDLTDSPAVRAAFTGKDVMVQPCASASKPSLRGGLSPVGLTHTTTIFDVDSITTPNPASTRTISTSATTQNSRGIQSHTLMEPAAGAAEINEISPLQKAPPKPNYSGLTIHELNKIIKSYGFKAMRKREKMIELLDRCWEEKYGVPNAVQDKPEAAPFGDFLSKVHDISARPQPKAKKAQTRKKKAGAENGSTEEQAKKPRQRKKKDLNNDPAESMPEKPKAKRSRKSKSAIPDIDLILDSIPEELRALEAFEDWAKPERRPKPRTQQEIMAAEDIPNVARLPTPPPTLPLEEYSHPPSVPENTRVTLDTQDQGVALSATPSATPKSISINDQITAAIMHQSKHSHPGRNHNIDPTWHEKILLYDPIILEDLASWLNTEGLTAVGEDREVSALEVREWSETRGICCLWRGGWRGNKVAQQ